MNWKTEKQGWAWDQGGGRKVNKEGGMRSKQHQGCLIKPQGLVLFLPKSYYFT